VVSGGRRHATRQGAETTDAPRRGAARDYDILASAPDDGYDALVQVAAVLCGTPMAGLSLVDDRRIWLKAKLGLDMSEVAPDEAFCAHTIAHREGTLIVEDALLDDRFAGIPLVIDAPHVRFYAGVAFRSPTGVPMGALYVLDRVPRRLSPAVVEGLRALARQVEAQLALGRSVAELAVAAAEREVSRTALADAERLWAVAFEHAPVPMAIRQLDGHAVKVNEALAALFGHSPDAFGHLSAGALIPPDQLKAEHQVLAHLLSGRVDSVRREGDYLHRNGDRIHVSVTTSVIRNDEREPLFLLSQVEDLTERQRADDALRLMRHAVEAIVSVDGDGIVTGWNPGAERMLGYRPEEAIGTPVAAILPEPFEPVLGDLSADEADTLLDGTLELVARRRDGSALPVELSLIKWAARGERSYTVVIRDISERKRAEDELRESERKLATLMSNLPGMAYRCRNDADWTMEFVSDGCVWLTGYTPEELIAKRPAFVELIVPEFRQPVRDSVDAAVGSERPFDLVYRIQTKAGEQRWVWERGRGVPATAGDTPALEGFITDITELRQAQAALERDGDYLRLLKTVAAAAAHAHTVEDVIQVALDEVCRVTGWPVGHAYAYDARRERLVPTTLWHLNDPERFDVFRRVTEATLLRPGMGLPGDVLLAGMPVWVPDLVIDPRSPRAAATRELGVHAGFGFPVVADGRVLYVLEFFLDTASSPEHVLLDVVEQVGTQLGRVLERKQAEAELRHQASHDALTGLLNRDGILEALPELARAGRSRGAGLAVAIIDLDGFSAVNERLGHSAGDSVLVLTAQRLREQLAPGGVLGRVAADHFLVAWAPPDAAGANALLAQQLLFSLTQPFTTGANEVFLSASIGAAWSEDPEAPEDLVRSATSAMYRVKARGGGGIEIAEQALTAFGAADVETEAALYRALERGEFRLFYQPVVALADGRITGLEALVRWERPEHGLVAPAEFVPIAEHNGLIVPLGAWVLQQACQHVATWRRELPGAVALRISVNVSARQLEHPDLVATVRAALTDSSLDPSALILEITETAMMHNTEAVRTHLEDLKDLGVSIAVDDFGTGYSSLGYLHRLPVDVMKIDRSFVADIDSDHHARALVRTVITLADSLALTTVAEGVETSVHTGLLRDMGCQLAQGYHFSSPVPARHVPQVLREHGARNDEHSGLRVATRNDRPATSNEREALDKATGSEDDVRFALASSLHDGPVQCLVAAHLTLEQALARQPEDETLATVRDRVRRAIDECLVLMQFLHPAPPSPQDLPAELRRAAHAVNSHARVVVDLGHGNSDLSPEVTDALVRIAQELLQNVRRHAAGRLDLLEVTHSSDEVTLRVVDRGPGNCPAVSPQGHFGLSSVRYRCRLLDGTVDITSAAGGTDVTVRLPTCLTDASRP
jgi:diguanylate cyclase (GGDEF)-like protein/PAS domain S-box-containing protein